VGGADDQYPVAQGFESLPDYHIQATGIRWWFLLRLRADPNELEMKNIK
jgi:hypothetical protein